MSLFARVAEEAKVEAEIVAGRALGHVLAGQGDHLTAGALALHAALQTQSRPLAVYCDPSILADF